ncbi:MAG: ABC transporter permease [Myxococcota bacterium]
MSGRLAHAWDLIHLLVRKELKLRYRGTTLGLLWSLANPLAFAFVLQVAFKRVFRVDIENYAVFILSGLFPWQWFSNSMGAGSTVFIFNAALIKKLPFPRFSLCAATVLGDLTHFVVTLPLLGALILVTEGRLNGTVWAIGVPLLLLIQMVQTTALVTLVATVNAYLRDLEHLVQVLLLLLFYVSPILYPTSMVPPSLHWMLYLNPISPLMISWRSLIVDGQLSLYLPIAAAHALLAVVVALFFYRRLEGRLAEVV